MDLPVEVAPYEVILFWHERCHKSPEHGRIRSQIAAAAQGAAQGAVDAEEPG
jgi:hypothetical protein